MASNRKYGGYTFSTCSENRLNRIIPFQKSLKRHILQYKNSIFEDINH